METWKQIPYAPLYEVSTLGRIRRLPGGITWKEGGKIRKVSYVRGYTHVILRIDRQRVTRQVHRIVMDTFRGESELQVNHINGVRDDNRLENLEYVTPSQNVRHSVEKFGTYRGEKHPNSKLTEDDVKKIRALIAKGFTNNEIAQQFDCIPANIWHIRKGKAWKHVK